MPPCPSLATVFSDAGSPDSSRGSNRSAAVAFEYAPHVGRPRMAVRPTRAGAASAVTQVAANERESMERWNTLPEVTAVNELGPIKPGGTVLLSAQGAVMAQMRQFRLLTH